MKASKDSRRARIAVAAAALSVVMLASVSCTRNDVTDDAKDTTAGTTATTTPGGTTDNKPGNKPGDKPDTGKPLDPNAGTVAPDAAPGDPPAGTGDRGMRSRFMR